MGKAALETAGLCAPWLHHSGPQADVREAQTALTLCAGESRYLEYATSGAAMRTHYTLIDCENVQPKDLTLLNGQPFKVFVFVGANQTKIPTKFPEALQARGENARYARICGNGRNALDFHIALYLGELAAKDPEGAYHVISKDAGFDPLLEHLKSRGVKARRSAALENVPILAVSGLKTANERLDAIIKRLESPKAARPRRRKSLAGTIDALFPKALAAEEVEALIDKLAQRRVIATKDGKLTYSL